MSDEKGKPRKIQEVLPSAEEVQRELSKAKSMDESNVSVWSCADSKIRIQFSNSSNFMIPHMNNKDRCSIRMSEAPFWHIEKPAPARTGIGLSYFKGIFEKQYPKIKCESCAESHENSANEEKGQIIHGLPAY